MLRPSRQARLRAINLLEAILLERAERHAAASPNRPAWLSEVCEALADFSVDEPDYDELAADHGMALSTLRRRFREATGVSLHRYRIDCRIAGARRLLGESDEPIKRIAYRLGYRDVHYFTRQFSLHAGVPPQAFRRSRQR